MSQWEQDKEPISPIIHVPLKDRLYCYPPFCPWPTLMATSIQGSTLVRNPCKILDCFFSKLRNPFLIFCTKLPYFHQTTEVICEHRYEYWFGNVVCFVAHSNLQFQQQEVQRKKEEQMTTFDYILRNNVILVEKFEWFTFILMKPVAFKGLGYNTEKPISLLTLFFSV